jgi:AcrR family transcriptional regulator
MTEPLAYHKRTDVAGSHSYPSTDALQMKTPGPTTANPPQYNLMRQKLGNKGAATRQRILDTVVRLVNAQTGGVPSISLICRAAQTSKAAFYQYFEDFNAVVLELLRPSHQDIENLAAMLEEDWPKEELYERAYTFVAAYFSYWERHGAALRLRRILADSGDPIMIEMTLRSIDPILRALAAKLRAARGGGRERRDDHALAIALMHAMSSAAMIITHNVYPKAIDEAIVRIHGYPGDCQQRALAHLLSVSLQHADIPLRKGAAS